ncbi:zinc ribbon domain-containing protein [Candidatus Peregrinibacteria bacterium]|nr:zinc ribbon domain-containing protein [Candidatus Peregrinibacteria bacterium]
MTIAIPLLGVILYLIIRPGRTHVERYYEELEKHLFEEKGEDGQTCKKCLTILDKTFIYCPNCLAKLKKTCNKCHQSFPDPWNSCPYCGSIQKEPVKKIKMKVSLKK